MQPQGSEHTTLESAADEPAQSFAGPIDHYPEWARELARIYFTKTLNQFILHGNVRDLVPTADSDGTPTYSTLSSFLTDDLFASRDIVVWYDRAAGIHFWDTDAQRDFNRAVNGYDTMHGTTFAQRIPKDPVRVFALLDNYFRIRLQEKKRIACIIDFAETIVPMAEASMYSSEDRNALVFLRRWAHDQTLLNNDFTLCMIAENLCDLNQQLVQSPWTSELNLPLPDTRERLRYAQSCASIFEEAIEEIAGLSLESLAANTAGLSYSQLRTILADVAENGSDLSGGRLSDVKKQMIEEAAFGMLEFVETELNLDVVAGHERAKQHLRDAARALRNNRPDVMPMGYLVSGPVGTGKTFLITCFAGEIGVPMVKLKNFRSQWQGQTEGNLEKILHLLEAMPPVAVMIDEADAALGNRDSFGDSGVSKRVFAQIAAFMSKPEHRGHILFFLITARPDLMPVDLKRQGRAEEHIALFYPDTKKDREELLQIMLQRTGISLPLSEIPSELLVGERTFSGADMEALLTRAKFRAASQEDNNHEVTQEILEAVVRDFIPPVYPLEVERQTLAAILECTSRDLLPEKYQQLERKEVVRRLAAATQMTAS